MSARTAATCRQGHLRAWSEAFSGNSDYCEVISLTEEIRSVTCWVFPCRSRGLLRTPMATLRTKAESPFRPMDLYGCPRLLILRIGDSRPPVAIKVITVKIGLTMSSNYR